MEFEKPKNNYHPNNESEGGGVKTQSSKEAQRRAETKPVQDFSIPLSEADTVILPIEKSQVLKEEQVTDKEYNDSGSYYDSGSSSEILRNHEVNNQLAPIHDSINKAAINAVLSAAAGQGVDVSTRDISDYGVTINNQEVDSDLEEALYHIYISTKREKQRQESPKIAEDLGLSDILGDRYLQDHIITGRLGRGGMGEVFQAEHVLLQRPEAVKIFRNKKQSPKEQQEEGENISRSRLQTRAISELERRFRTEMASMASVNHRNVLNIYSGGINENGAYFSMQVADGGSLANLIIDEGELPLFGTKEKPGLLDYAVQIAEGIIAIHQSGIVHRDLKPDNILIDHGQVKIADFGLISKAKEAYSLRSPNTAQNVLSEEELGYIAGTVNYIAPESIRGEGMSYKSDAFAFGATLYELATGEMLFPGVGPKTLAEIARGRLDPEKIALLDDYGVGFKQIVLGLLQSKPGQRLNMYYALQQLQLLRRDGFVDQQESVTGWNEDLTPEEQEVAGKALVEENAEVEELSKEMQKDMKRKDLLKRMEVAERRNLNRRKRVQEEKEAKRELRATEIRKKLEASAQARAERDAAELATANEKWGDQAKFNQETNSQRRKREEQQSRLAASQEYAPAQEVPGTLPPPLIQAEAPKPKKPSVFKRAWGGIKSLFGRK